MFKKLSIFLCIIILIIISSGCSRKESELPKLDPEKPIKLTLWNYYTGHQKEAFDKIVDEFNDSVGREKGIIVESISQGGVNELADKLLETAKGTDPNVEMPDIFGAYNDTLYDLDKLNVTASLDKYISASEIGEYIDNFVKEAKALPGGEFKIFPIAKSTELLFVNKTNWEEFKNSVTAKDSMNIYNDVSDDNLTTWEGIYKAAQVYYKWTDDLTPNIQNDGKALFGLDSVANFQLIANEQLGIDLFKVTDGKGKLNIDRNAEKRIWDFYTKGVSSGYFAAIGRFRSDDLKTGKILMYIGASSSSPYTPTQVTYEDGSWYNIDSMVLPLPVFKDGHKVAIQQGAGMAVKKSTSEREYASVLFLKYFTDPNKNIDFVFESSYLPVKKSGIDSQNIKNKLNNYKYSSNVKMSNLGNSLETAIMQFNQYNLYYSPPFAGSLNARKALENITISFSDGIRKKVKESVFAGNSLEDSVKKATDEFSFNLYLEQLEKEIQKEIK